MVPIILFVWPTYQGQFMCKIFFFHRGNCIYMCKCTCCHDCGQEYIMLKQRSVQPPDYQNIYWRVCGLQFAKNKIS